MCLMKKLARLHLRSRSSQVIVRIIRNGLVNVQWISTTDEHHSCRKSGRHSNWCMNSDGSSDGQADNQSCCSAIVLHVAKLTMGSAGTKQKLQDDDK